MTTHKVNIIEVGNVVIGGEKLVLIGGPCVLEGLDQAIKIAEQLSAICKELGMGYIFKASYDKGNRGSSDSYRGPMLEEGLKMLGEIKKRVKVPVITDVHSEIEAEKAAEYVDILQIPAYLSLQTSLSEACGRTKLPVNIKKGQFLHPNAMQAIGEKTMKAGAKGVMLTERGSCFGYNNLISDMTCLPIMRQMGYPIVFDATHIVRHPGISSSKPEGGSPQFVPTLIRSAVAAGIDALFIETHPHPSEAACDACSMLPLRMIREILEQALKINELVKKFDLSIPKKGHDGFLAP